ncbi:MAG: DNA replication/repair protein RecF [Gammaproteobacteria bacterium]|nr:DNA replication/repair protein RecF [Gammaproteobacteria bacterium]
MHFDRLEISFFRNLSAVSLELSPGLNFIYGPNGAGKTAILEAVHLLVRGRSFRTQRSSTLIQNDQEFLAVRGAVTDEQQASKTLAISKDRRGHTELKVNGLPEHRLSEAARLVPLQVMLPDLSDLVFGEPRGRRQWLDWGTFHVEPSYLRELRAYLQVLKQRNALLKDIARGISDQSRLEPWTEQLVDTAQQVDKRRSRYLDSFVPVFEELLARLAPELEVELRYQRGWPVDQSLRKVLGDLAPREVKSGHTQMGPHRAEIELWVGSARANAILSRGQGKMVASALKLSQARLLTKLDNRTSVFLIDDVGAELDEGHSFQFFEILQEMGCQILATSTQRMRLPETQERKLAGLGLTVFHVERGSVHRQE